MSSYQIVAKRILRSRYAVALTGAGISVESGIPDFRSPGGLWSKYDPMEFGHIESFRANPGRVWKMLLEMDELLTRARPSSAHMALADLENRGLLKSVITQNIDSLHQRAGSRNVIEFHGHNRSLRCDLCGNRFPREGISLHTIPPCCECGYPLRPDFVFFGESIPSLAHERAVSAAESCDLMLIVGTSASVVPASLLPASAKRQGAFIVEINPRQTQLSIYVSDIHIAEPAGRALSGIMAVLNQPGAEEAEK